MKQSTRNKGALTGLSPDRVSLPKLHWFDASDEATLTVDAGLVSQIADKFGTRHAVATGAARPTYRAENAAGVPALEFTTANTLSTPWDNTTTDLTILAVITTNAYTHLTDWATAPIIYGKAETGTVNDFAWFLNNGIPRFQARIATVVTTAGGKANTGSTKVIAVVRKGAVARHFVDGEFVGETAVDASPLSASTNIAIFQNLAGQLHELVAYKGAVSDSELKQVQSYAMQKWDAPGERNRIPLPRVAVTNIAYAPTKFAVKAPPGLKDDDLLLIGLSFGTGSALTPPPGFRLEYMNTQGQTFYLYSKRINSTSKEETSWVFSLAAATTGVVIALAVENAEAVIPSRIASTVSGAFNSFPFPPAPVEGAQDIVFFARYWGIATPVSSSLTMIGDARPYGSYGAGTSLFAYARPYSRDTTEGYGPDYCAFSGGANTGSAVYTVTVVPRIKEEVKGAFTHWRLTSLAQVDSPDVTFGQVDLMEDFYGKNVCAGGVARAGSNAETASRAFDGDLLESAGALMGWQSASGGERWVEYEFPTPKAIKQVTVVRSMQDPGLPRAPTRILISASNDGISWTQVKGWTLDSWTNQVVQRFDLQEDTTPAEERELSWFGAHTQWRFNHMQPHTYAQNPSVNGLACYSYPGSPQFGLEAGEVTTSSVTGSYIGDYAWDDNPATVWESAPSGSYRTAWVAKTFAHPYSLAEWDVTARLDWSTIQSPRYASWSFRDELNEPWTVMEGSAYLDSWAFGETRKRKSIYFTPVDEFRGRVSNRSKFRGFLRGAAVAADHWRLLVHATSSAGQFALREWEMYEGNRLIQGGTAYSPTADSVWPAANVIDNVPSTRFATANSGLWPQIIGRVFAEPVAVDAFALWRGVTVGTEPKDFDLQFSTDSGVSWFTLHEYRGVTGWAGERKSFEITPPLPNPGHHKYWRVFVFAVNGATGWDPREIKFMVDGTRYLANAMGSSEYPTDPLWRVFDGDMTTRGGTDFSGVWPQWIGGEFSVPIKVDGLEIGTGETATRAAKDFNLEYSDDGVTWTVHTEYRNVTSWPSGSALKVFEVNDL
jgi:hypothetical protein